ncbi:DUF885 family protein [Pedomonas sp. V897]|uniref:DUF885 family protein n=1 Tax=Pedomonas sp. V897 TaxID=3446482 RepID=UPI003EE3A973
MKAIIAEEFHPAMASDTPRVRIITDAGDLVVELYPERAPATVAAFLEQVDAGAYNGGSFQRTVRHDNDRGFPRIDVVQAYAAASAGPLVMVEHESTAETGLAHLDGTLSLARQDGGLASPQTFFISIGQQPALDAGGGRTKDGLGFAAFGRVIEGMAVVRAISIRKTTDEAPVAYVRGQLLAEPVMIYRAAREPGTPRALLQALADDYWAFRLREFPTEATATGIRSENRRLEGVREEDHARRARLCEAMLARAYAIETDGLSMDDRATLGLLIGQLEMIVTAYRLDTRFIPQLFPFGFFDVPDLLAQQSPLETAQDLEDFAARMVALPAYLADNLAMLDAAFARGFRISRVLLPRILTMLDAHLSDSGVRSRIGARLEAAVAAAPEGSLAAHRDRILKILDTQMLPALRSVRETFAGLDPALLTDSVSVLDQPNGEAFYCHKVREQTSLDIGPDSVHAIGLEEVARINAELDAVLEKMGRAGERAAVAAELDKRLAADADTLLAYVRAVTKRIDGRLPRLFGRLPRTTYGVEPLSVEASHALPPAMAQPAPADRSMPGIFWLTALPEKCPLHLVVPLALHEAWPGHLMQMSIAHELDHLPDFRRYGWSHYNGYIEGWALYCERLGHDLGLYDDPADQFGLLTFELWRAVRLVVDTGLHWKRWSREEAIAYMAANTFLPRATIESEVDRYIGMPAQALSYKLGERAIVRLREMAAARLKDRFSLREFHDVILSQGPVSLMVLAASVHRWIESGSE